MAQEEPVVANISGNFAGDGRDEVFWYSSEGGEEGLDALYSFTNGGVPGGPVRTNITTFDMQGVYRPISGDFDGDQWDEILWYAPGPGQDIIWDFTSWTTQTSRNFTINGDYVPVVGDLSGDGVEDVLWYAPGTAPDTIFDFNQGGGYTTARLNINGTYTPVVASIGKDATDDILWYAPGTAPDTLFDFTQGSLSYTTRSLPVNGVYSPFALDIIGEGWRGHDIYWYAEHQNNPVWDYLQGERFTWIDTAHIAGYPVPGDYFADGSDDVFWVQGAGATLWDHRLVGGELWRTTYTASGAAAAADANLGSPIDLPAGPVEATDSTVITR